MADHEDDELLDEPQPEWPSAKRGTGGRGSSVEHEELLPVDEAHFVDESGAGLGVDELSAADQALLDDAELSLVGELREEVLRARAELVNYRNRVERDRQANRESTIAEVLRALLPALDDLDRAEAHGDVVEGTPMGIIAMKLRSSFHRFGLERYGASGDPFDPSLHEAIFQQPMPDTDAETVLDVVEIGYRFGDRVIRPAKVAVAVPQKD